MIADRRRYAQFGRSSHARIALPIGLAGRADRSTAIARSRSIHNLQRTAGRPRAIELNLRADSRAGTTGQRRAEDWMRSGLAWYQQTPPADRVCWGGLIACSGLGLGVFLERMVRLRRRRIIPAHFTARFLDRLHEGKLDGGKALDYCEMNPSPAARIALAAVRRWGRPAAISNEPSRWPTRWSRNSCGVT